ncbi:hypothetical protein VP249E411_P0145 [Vibrio phage 249E41-1]|nr:hypothetical protein VP249E411_P0145 [Vibrio phage 249E41-1]
MHITIKRCAIIRALFNNQTLNKKVYVMKTITITQPTRQIARKSVDVFVKRSVNVLV